MFEIHDIFGVGPDLVVSVLAYYTKVPGCNPITTSNRIKKVVTITSSCMKIGAEQHNIDIIALV